MPSSITSSSSDGVPEAEAKQSLFFGSLPEKDIGYFTTYDPDIDLSVDDAPEDYGLKINGKFYTVRNHIKILDLISEGEIEGIVSGEYIASGMVEGVVGHSGYVFQPFVENTAPFLRSVYLNETPVVNSNGQFNFQEFEGGYFEGNAVGLLPESGFAADKSDWLTLDSGFLSVGVDESTERKSQSIRTINERLRGPDSGIIPGTDPVEYTSYYLPKTYRILNKDLDKVNVNIKLPNLSYYRVNTKTVTRTVEEEGVDIEKAFATDQHGEVVRMEVLQIPLGTTINLQFLYRPVYENSTTEGAWLNGGLEAIQGLVISPTIYKKTIDIDPITIFPNDSAGGSGLIGWDIGVARTTRDSTYSYANNQTYIDSIVEIDNSSFSYPNASLVALNFNAEYFSQIPARSYDTELQKVKVPTAYDPRTRQHGVSWDGKFQGEESGTKKKWTDNPAWIFYDLITNKRYGLGKFARHLLIDKWNLWEISRYCDTMVSDGAGGLEPRFTCNVLINTREDAFKVLKDFASIFRSILFYSFNSLSVAIDKPKDPIYLFTNSNVKEGNFSYTTNALQTLPTVAVVRYNDKTNYYKPSLEYVEDVDGIRKYGINEREISAFGCTSKSQAVRMGRWMLSTENTQTEMVQFTAGPEALLLRPGDVVRVSDHHRSTEAYEGRIKDLDTSTSNGYVTLDKSLPLTADTNYFLTINTPSYFYDTSVTNISNTVEASGLHSTHVSGISFNSNDVITDQPIGTGLSGVFYGTKIPGNFYINPNGSTVNIPPQTSYSVIKNTTSDKSNNLYSITSIAESDTYSYSIEALLYNENKYDFIERGIRIPSAPGAHSTVAAPPGPESISAAITNVAGTLGTQQITIKINPPADVGTTMGYRIFVKGIENTTSCSDSADLNAYDFSAGDLIGGVPKDQFEIGILYPNVTSNGFTVDSNGDLTVVFNHIPGKNKRVYVVRAYAVNQVGIVSATYKKEERCVTEHFPVKDVKIYGLRTTTGDPDDAQQEINVGASHTKALFSKVDAKNFHIIWNKSFLDNDEMPDGTRFRITVFPAGTTDYANTSSLGNFNTQSTNFAFTFSLNSSLAAGPHRHFDIVVEAEQEDAPYTRSSNGYVNTSDGWDVIEVNNPRPTGYNLTPRKEIGAIPGNTFSTEALTTTQYIDSDGAIVVDIRSSTIADLAGGYVYISKNPFSYKDFGADGEPIEPADREDLIDGLGSRLNSDEQLVIDDWAIIEIPFESPDNDILPRPLRIHPNTSDAASSITDDFAFNYGNRYYMAIKFYDSFDKEFKKLQPTDWKSEVYPEIPVGFSRNAVLRSDGSEPNFTVNTCTYTGPFATVDHPKENYAANTSCKKKVLAQSYALSIGTGTNACLGASIPAEACINTGLYLGYYEVADTYVDPVGSGIFSAPIYPSRFYSANSENPFKWWVRLNINGQWEGNGIDKIRVLTAKDVWTLYNYNGFYEYQCNWKQHVIVGGGVSTTMINHPDSHSICRFRMGDKTSSTDKFIKVYTVDGHNLSAGGTSTFSVTGVRAGVLYPVVNQQVQRVWDHAAPGDHIGDDYENLFEIYDDNNFNYFWPYKDRLQSYNERNEAIAGKTRPNLGFRRFRVYFDTHHLPYTQDESGLASYSVVGMNSWNGPYEGWRGGSTAQLDSSLIFSNAGSGIFPDYVQSFLQPGDVFENIPGLWNHHPAGFGQGYGGLIKTQRYFDVHMGRMVDDSYLTEAFFGVLTSNDYTEEMRTVDLPPITEGQLTFLQGLGTTAYDGGLELNEATYWGVPFVTDAAHDGIIDYLKDDNYDPTS